MRDPNRIDEFCEVLKQEWHKVPDWRFGQFVSNFLGTVYSNTKRDPFFIEDNEMKTELEDFIRGLTKK